MHSTNLDKNSPERLAWRRAASSCNAMHSELTHFLVCLFVSFVHHVNHYLRFIHYFDVYTNISHLAYNSYCMTCSLRPVGLSPVQFFTCIDYTLRCVLPERTKWWWWWWYDDKLTSSSYTAGLRDNCYMIRIDMMCWFLYASKLREITSLVQCTTAQIKTNKK